MYARRLHDANLGELDQLARLSDTEAHEICERLKVFPGHKLKLLRAIDLLRRAADTHPRQDDVELLDRLWQEKEKGEEQNQILADENAELYLRVRSQDAAMSQLRRCNQELEDLVQDRTMACEFMMHQLENMWLNQMQNPVCTQNLYDSYDDWTRSATRMQLPEELTQLVNDFNNGSTDGLIPIPQGLCFDFNVTPTGAYKKIEELSDTQEQEDEDERCTVDTEQRMNGSSKSSSRIRAAPLPFSEYLDRPAGPEYAPRAEQGDRAERPMLKEAAEEEQPNIPAVRRPRVIEGPEQHDTPETGSPMCMQKKKLGMSLDSAKVTECLAGFDVDHLLRCLAKAIQNYIILSMAHPRPHTASDKILTECATFLEPQCLEKLQQRRGRSQTEHTRHWLNDIALRRTPNLWVVYHYLHDIMANFKLEQECAVISLIYLRRFINDSKINVTPDSWQRLTITSMMLASKVWDDESYENNEFAQRCPLYTLEEISSFEKNFLKSVKYNMSVRGSEYASTYFLLRTIGAKDLPGEFKIPSQLEPERCSKLMDRALAKQLEFKQRYSGGSDTDPKNWTL